MNLQRLITVAGLGLLFLIPPIWSWSRLVGTEQQLQAAHATYELTRRDASEVLQLRAAHDRVADRKRPEDHVLAHVNRVLAEAGIPSRSLQGVRPEADIALTTSADAGRTQYRRQSVNISLQRLTLPEIGAFLLRWREDDAVWTPRRIELTKHRSRTDDDDRYDATIVISAIYVAEPRP